MALIIKALSLRQTDELKFEKICEHVSPTERNILKSQIRNEVEFKLNFSAGNGARAATTKILQRTWEGNHLLEYFKEIVKKKTISELALAKILNQYGFAKRYKNTQAQTFKNSISSGFGKDRSEKFFFVLATIQEISVLKCLIQFLEFCLKENRPLQCFYADKRNFDRYIKPACDILKANNNKNKFDLGALTLLKEDREKLEKYIDDTKKYLEKNPEKGLPEADFEEATLENDDATLSNSSKNTSTSIASAHQSIQPQLTIPKAKQGNKNYYANAALEVIGRKKQQDRLKAFLNCDLNVAWFQLAGEAGQGKSRLAFDLMYEAKDLGWRAGFLWENDIEFFKDQWRDWQPDKPHLLIFDYVIGREHVIKPIIQTLISRQGQFQHKIRILLVERQRWDRGNQINMRSQGNEDALGLSGYKASWYRNLCEDSEHRDSDLPCRFEDGIEELMELDRDDLVAIIKQLFSGEELTIPDDTLKEVLERIDNSGRPLYAYLLAQQLSETQEGYQSWTKIDLLNKQLERDKRRWEKAFWKDGKKAAPTWGDNHSAMKLAVLATMIRGVEFQDTHLKEHFGNIDASIRREAVAITSGNLVNDDIRPRTIGALEPDLLGTWFVLYCFHNDLEYKELLNIAWQYSPENTAVFLLRVVQDFIDLPEKYKRLGVTEKLLAQTPPHEDHYRVLAKVTDDIATKFYEKNLSVPSNLFFVVEHSANSFDVDAMNSLGYFYHQGIGGERNLKKGAEWFQRAVNHGNINAINSLAVCYEKGLGVNQNLKKAVSLYKQGIKHGSGIAMTYLALCYQNGEGVKQSWKKAVDLYKAAIKQGVSQAMINLGVCYETGLIVKQNWDKAIDLYEQASRKGHSTAMVNLGICYQKGLGNVKQNWPKAIKLYQQAMGQGNSAAMGCLGLLYEKGEGVEKDWNKAIHLYQKAVMAGEEKATVNIQNMLLGNFLGLGNYQPGKRFGWSKNFYSISDSACIFDPPIITGDWKILTTHEAIVCLEKVIPAIEILELTKKFDGYVYQYGRCLRLNFYKEDCDLIDIQLYNPLNKNILIFSAIINANSALLLDGKKDIIHELNRHLLHLDDETHTVEYLQFFCSYVQFNQAPLLILFSSDEIPFKSGVKQYLKSLAKTIFSTPVYIGGTFKKEGYQEFKVCALHEKTLLICIFKVRFDGQVSLDDYTETANLPILLRNYNEIFRTPLNSYS